MNENTSNPERNALIEKIANWLLKEGTADSKVEAMGAAESLADSPRFVAAIEGIESARAEIARLEGRKPEE